MGKDISRFEALVKEFWLKI